MIAMPNWMKSAWFVLIAMLATAIIWVALVLTATLEGWGRTALAPAGDTAAFLAAARERIDSARAGNLVLRLIESGVVKGDYSMSIDAPVDAESVFQVASLSKWITAVAVMSLVEAGRIDLDAPVSQYLTRWQLPESEFDNKGVTVRRLLSHTAGLTDGLGYGGFAPGEPVQPLTASLTHAADASPGADGRVRVGQPPGGQWQYSGGGYALLALLIEEVTGGTFEDYVRTTVFGPLGMRRSTFDADIAAQWGVVDFYDTDGTPATHYRFTAPAAAGLYTTVADMTAFVGLFDREQSSSSTSTVLSEPTIAAMQAPQAHQFGAAIWGLGTILYAPNDAGGFVIGHDGSNTPAINTAVRFNPANGDAIIVLETGSPLIATQIASEWVFWQTGNVDLFDVITATPQMLLLTAAGLIAILVTGFFALWRVWRRKRRPS